ncbi:MAG: preprotein translocase subunit SecY [Candidatus Nanoarchaeia archaeon]|jgi:preprotein translocase subunit SecY|nr:preprotein translocase subunit SecY [Candidatus Nanoarchaeia archaeon]|tara:strand:- start:8066 stop:9469 length:1404 start_codon:yes stop_codon:yes gene_type:complete
MAFLDVLLNNLPEVKGPDQKKLSFKEKLKWTSIVLVGFFVLGVVPLFGLGQNALQQFEQLSIILGASFGSIISLGIGPIVTASIVLQLLNGSGIIKFDTTSSEGRKRFQGVQKILAIFFIIFESFIFVLLGGLAPSLLLAPALYRSVQFVLIFQLILGGILILFMDEVISKWGFGSGVSLFIAAGVSSQIFIRAFSPLTATGLIAFGTSQAPVGQFWVLIRSIISSNITGAILAFSAIFFTILIFLIAVYGQAMKIEIPLSFGRVRGYGVRWPLNFLYTSNIPVILIAALIANIQLWARLLESKGYALLGTFAGSQPVSGVVSWLFPPNLVQAAITGGLSLDLLTKSLIYMIFFILGSIMFSIFWVQTSGMDAASQAKQIMSSGLQVPGFRRDPRVIEQILSRYIFPLTVMGGATIGLLAASADLLGALAQGTGILLAVMIIYRLYQEIAQQHMMDMHPMLRKMMGK